MANPQKRKGDAFENEIVKYLQGAGWREACRSRAGWSDDKGDLEGLKFTFECKNQKTLALPSWIRELEVEAANAKTYIGAVIHKRQRETDPGEQFATMPMKYLVQLLREAGY